LDILFRALSFRTSVVPHSSDLLVPIMAITKDLGIVFMNNITYAMGRYKFGIKASYDFLGKAMEYEH